MTIHAIHEDGVFRPIDPVNLPEHIRVRVEIDDSPELPTAKALTAADLARFRGTVEWPEDPVEWQRRVRDEEWS